MKNTHDAKNPIPLTSTEKKMLDYLEKEGAKHITGLDDTLLGALESGGKQYHDYREFIKAGLKEGVLHRWSWKTIAREFGRKTGDWARDWERIARTEMQNARQHALAAKMAEQADGTDPLVYKMPRRTACRYCIELYLRGGDFNKPRVFRLLTLAAHGTNIGRKTAEWKPVIGTIHPNCLCFLFQFTGSLEGEVAVGPMGDLVAERTSLYGKVMPDIKNKELAEALERVEITLDGIPLKEL